MGISFLILAAYVGFDAVQSLLQREPPEASYAGIGVAVLSILVMPILARVKRGVAEKISLILFGMVRVPSLMSLGLSKDAAFSQGVFLLNRQMGGMLLGVVALAILWK